MELSIIGCESWPKPETKVDSHEHKWVYITKYAKLCECGEAYTSKYRRLDSWFEETIQNLKIWILKEKLRAWKIKRRHEKILAEGKKRVRKEETSKQIVKDYLRSKEV